MKRCRCSVVTGLVFFKKKDPLRAVNCNGDVSADCWSLYGRKYFSLLVMFLLFPWVLTMAKRYYGINNLQTERRQLFYDVGMYSLSIERVCVLEKVS